MIKHLHDQGHAVTVASLVRSDEEADEGRGIEQYCSEYIMEKVNTLAAGLRMVAHLSGRTPSSMGYFFSPRLKERIRAVLQRTAFDLIFVHCSSVAQYVEDVQDVPKMLDFGDMDSQKWLIYAGVRQFPLSVGYQLEGAKLQRAEKRLAEKFDYCTCTTKTELDTLRSYGTRARIGWFPNGVDAKYFHPGAEAYESDTLCFIGRMDYFPNQQAMFDFCGNILPLLREKRAEIKLLIVGANPSRAVQRLERLPGVTVTGSVPDVRPYVQMSAVNVAPLAIARGTQNKILESMAMGVPVVASVQAAGGVDAEPGKHLLSATTPRNFRDAILTLLANPEHRDRLAKASRDRVHSHHSWNNSMRTMDTLITECLEHWCSDGRGGYNATTKAQ